MKQELFLLNLTMSGIKNIEKKITLDFYKKTVDSNFNISDYRVKAIYGENGSGKTGVVYGAYILKKLMLDSNYLADSANQDFLHEAINKKTQTLYLECDFFCRILPYNNIYRYIVSLEKNNVGRFVISNEQLLTRKSTYATSKFKEVFSVRAGEFSCCVDNEELFEDIKSSTANLLEEKSFLSIIFRNKNLRGYMQSELSYHMMNCWLFSLMLITSFDRSDQPEMDLFIRESFRWDWKDDPHNNGNVKIGMIYPRIDSFAGNKRIVNKADLPAYEQEVAKLTKFLQLFKHDLKNIEIDKTDRRDNYECSLLLDYGDYTISTEFESTGIVKLIRLYDLLSLAMNGMIVFIDEMDSNINDIYLYKLIEFFTLYGEGQLCFTTHNTGPMAVLKNKKNAIDFLSCDNQIIPWKKNGNFAPENLYRHGMIERLPFNIEPEAFLGILGE